MALKTQPDREASGYPNWDRQQAKQEQAMTEKGLPDKATARLGRGTPTPSEPKSWYDQLDDALSGVNFGWGMADSRPYDPKQVSNSFGISPDSPEALQASLDNARTMAYMYPVVGTVLGAEDTVNDLRDGNYGMAAMDAAMTLLGAIPEVGMMRSGIRSMRPAWAASEAAEQAMIQAARDSRAMAGRDEWVRGNKLQGLLNRIAGDSYPEAVPRESWGPETQWVWGNAFKDGRVGGTMHSAEDAVLQTGRPSANWDEHYARAMSEIFPGPVAPESSRAVRYMPQTRAQIPEGEYAMRTFMDQLSNLYAAETPEQAERMAYMIRKRLEHGAADPVRYGR